MDPKTCVDRYDSQRSVHLHRVDKVRWSRRLLTPPCVAESDRRHAQHPLKMLGIDFSCGSYQTNSERIMLLNS